MSILFYYDIFVRWVGLNMLGIMVKFTIFDSRNYLTPLSAIEYNPTNLFNRLGIF